MSNEKTIRILSWASFVVLLLTAFIFGIKQLREPDIFWQLRTGEWIVQNKSVMNHDIFSYTFHGVPWINVKWGFEVLMYFMYNIGGVEFTNVLQCVASVILIIIFWKQYKLVYSNLSGIKPAYPSIGFIVTTILFLTACAYRMNGRPEMTSHVLTGLFILILFSYRYRPSNWIFILVPLEVFWANMHEAYGTGEVIIIVMLFGSWVEYFYKKDKKISAPLKLSAIAILAIAATAIHPYGVKMILHPYEIFTQVSENKFTTELLSFQDITYWKKEAWFNILFLCLSIIGLFLPFKKTLLTKTGGAKPQLLKWYFRPLYNFGIGYIILLILFFYLSLTAYRNIIFFIIASAPLTANCISFLSNFLKTKIRVLSNPVFQKSIQVVILLATVFFYVSIPTNLFYTMAETQNNHYGLRIDPLMNPIGATQFIKNNHIEGRCFDDFLISNYLLWALRPDFKTFIDLRDLDVFPVVFFRDFAFISQFPKKLDQVDSTYHFDYAVLYRNNFQRLHQYFYDNKNWALLYIDPVSVVFLKRNPENNLLISKYITAGRETDVFNIPAESKPSSIANIFTNIFWPGAQTNYNKGTDYDLIAGSYYLSIGNVDLALKRAEISVLRKTTGAQAFMGDISLYKFNTDTSAAKKQEELAQAENYYSVESDRDKKNVKALIGLARVEMLSNNFQGAVSYLKKSIKYAPTTKEAYMLLASCMMRIEPENEEKKDEYAKTRINAMEKALAIDRDDTYLRFYIGLYYGQNGDCDKAVEYLKPSIKYPGLPKKDVDEAKKILSTCGG